jgi:hypothetical protein
LDKQGKIKTPTEQAADKKAAQETLKTIEGLIGDFSEGFFETFGEAANFDKLIENFNQGLATAEFDFEAINTQLAEKLAEPEYKIFVEAELDTTGLDEALAERLDAAAERGGINPVARAEEQRKEIEAILRENAEAQAAVKESVDKFNATQKATAANLQTAIDARTDADVTTLKGLITIFDNLQDRLSDPSLTAEQVSTIESQLVALNNKIIGLFSTDKLSGPVSQALQEAIKTSLEQVQEVETQLKLEPQIPEDVISILKSQLAGLKVAPKPFQDVETSMKNSATAAGAAAKGTGSMKSNIASAVGPAKQLAAALERAAKAAAVAAGAPKYFGGEAKFRATGGRGLDTIPTMLSPGEFVVNARSSRQFFAQLQAINSGQSPQFRETGGNVTNVGDINVNVTGGAGSESPVDVGKAIGNSLRREIRRKNLAL